ncbi:sulfate ABC transporter ATP-binding protein [Brevibacillus fluminis]|uniref:Sulfate ABC transporter ATP-binding protein n=1 Tax=Brevibacillus fluminis TaxID=511487 RepID=A0A3M8DBI9_9BACL|nr:sulfate ABC transporter ATP-binding protein [Brevibacillus fluminis]RNB85404.1 sulfate ABC transporter ATP-binding protein [Brevibacillus fluminis]
MSIEIRQVSMNYGAFAALQDVSLQIQKGELIALLGPSGSGKTSLLRSIAGLEAVGQGQILFDDTDVTEKSTGERNVGFVFQHYALFKHMNIFDNIAFGLKVRPRKSRPNKAEIRERVEHLLKLVQLEGLGDRYPAQLSGGQRQRIALARALAIEPSVLLLDEPFGALDAKVRLDLRRWLRQLQKSLSITSVFVTHDQEEAMELADRVVVMNKGRIEQVGTPQEIYHQPANEFVYRFLGRVNQVQTEPFAADAPIGYIRPHEVKLAKHAVDQKSIPSIITHIHAIGPIVRLELARPDKEELLEAELSIERFHQLDLKLGETVYAQLSDVIVFGEKEPKQRYVNAAPAVYGARSVHADA